MAAFGFWFQSGLDLSRFFMAPFDYIHLSSVVLEMSPNAQEPRLTSSGFQYFLLFGKIAKGFLHLGLTRLERWQRRLTVKHIGG
jgi:hypothetical protein